MIKYCDIFTLLSSIVLISCSSSFSQSTHQANDSQKNKRLFKQGKELIQQGKYAEAEVIFLSVVNNDPDYIEAHKELSTHYYRNKEYTKAIVHLNEILRINPSDTPKVYYTLGLSCYYSGNYTCARSNLLKYQKSEPSHSELRIKANDYLTRTNKALEIQHDTLHVEIRKLPPTINTIYSEYLPSISIDGKKLIFTRREDNTEDYFYSNWSDSTWGQAMPFAELNTHLNEGAHTMSSQEDLIIVTGCNWPNTVGGCDLYYSQLTKAGWTPFKNMGDYVNSRSWDSQPSLSADGNILYFASSRSGGYGDTDIWMSIKDSQGQFDEPINLGDQINTHHSESTPFIHPDGRTLYFSSNGHAGLGKKDIFFSQKNQLDKWQQPKNLGYPLNTFQDEGALVISTDGSTGYFSRTDESHKGLGTLDIYSFDVPPNVKPVATTYVRTQVRDSQTKEPLSGYKVTMFDNTHNNIVNIHHARGFENYTIALPEGADYGIRVEKEGYVFYSDHLFIKPNHSILNPINQIIDLQKLKRTSEDTIQNTYHPIVLNNVFFNTNEDRILPNSYRELNTLFSYLNKYKELNVRLIGHTDNSGDPNYNLRLSENRAKSIYNYLLDKGIPASRITYIGYGADRPVASNNTADGRSKNRRTEFEIVQ